MNARLGLLVVAALVVALSAHAIPWSTMPLPILLDDPGNANRNGAVPPGTYTARCIVWMHPGEVLPSGVAWEDYTGTSAHILVFRILTGPQSPSYVYDFMTEDAAGLRRLAQIANDLGASPPDTWGIEDVFGWMVGRDFDVTVADYSTVDFQQISRVTFNGYALP